MSATSTYPIAFVLDGFAAYKCWLRVYPIMYCAASARGLSLDTNQTNFYYEAQFP